MTEPLHPLRFEPILKRLIWGGRTLGTLLGKPIGPESDYAESWEISDHRHDVSHVAEGRLRGTSLRELLAARREEILGPSASQPQFPLLVKFLDARQPLSVQVHPNDALARRLADDNGKTEAWVILQADPGSLIYAGLRPGVDRTIFSRALVSGEVEPCLHRFEPRAGDCVFIPAGTVHAIGGGIVLVEIQQMSDATFRVFDWGRLGPDGKPRALHVPEALESTDFDLGPINPVRPSVRGEHGREVETLVRCPVFELERWAVSQPVEIGQRTRFTILVALDGEGLLESQGERFNTYPGQVWLLPAVLGPCRYSPLDVKGSPSRLLLSWVPTSS